MEHHKNINCFSHTLLSYSPLQIGPSLTGIGYLKGRLGLLSLKRTYSERGLGKYISEVK
jgi:hypothetical protein